MAARIGIAAFGAGAWLLVASAERLVDLVRAWALAAGLSGVALSALVLGLDLESTAAGVAATLDGLPGAALGTAYGAAILLVTLGLGVAALVVPFEVRPPTPVLLCAALAAVLATALALDGRLSRVDGGVLLASFPLLVGVLLRTARITGGDQGASKAPSRRALRILLCAAGVLAGAELLVFGTGRIVGDLGLSETVFGLVVVAAAVCLEELVIEALPAYRGFPELSVGNALGTLVFVLTGSLGVIALVAPVPVPDAVRAFHLPALLAATALALALLARGRLHRRHGAALVTLYAAYVAGALVVGG